MVCCPYCNDEWIVDDRLVCESCDPAFKIDILLSDLLSCIEALSQVEAIDPSREKFVTEAIDNLRSIRIKSQENQHG